MPSIDLPEAVERITRAELDALLEYSRTLPTGTTIGKRWKRDANVGCRFAVNVWCLRFVFPCPPVWVIGEYVEDLDPGYVGIRWARVELV